MQQTVDKTDIAKDDPQLRTLYTGGQADPQFRALYEGGFLGSSYFNPQSAKIIRKFHIPPPPVKLAPHDEIDGPRNVPAEQWRSMICTEWNDGCTRCKRKDISDPAVCSPMSSPDDDALSTHCPRHAVDCEGVSAQAMRKLCAVGFLREIYSDAQGEMVVIHEEPWINDWEYLVNMSDPESRCAENRHNRTKLRKWVETCDIKYEFPHQHPLFRYPHKLLRSNMMCLVTYKDDNMHLLKIYGRLK